MARQRGDGGRFHTANNNPGGHKNDNGKLSTDIRKISQYQIIKNYLGHQETHISRPLYQTPRQNLQPAVSQHQQGQIQQVRVVQTSQGQEVNQQQIRQVFSTSNGTFQLDGQTYQMISTPNKILQGANGAQLMGSNLITLQVNIFIILRIAVTWRFLSSEMFMLKYINNYFRKCRKMTDSLN